MATVAQIRTALATALSGVADTQVSGYLLANPTAPVLHIGLGPSTFTQSMRGASSTGHMEREFVVECLVQNGTDRTAQTKLDELLDITGSKSINAKIEADPTLGGVVDYAVVTEATQPGIMRDAPSLWGALVTVRVLHS